MGRKKKEYTLTPEQALSNRNHHLTWFAGRYKEFIDGILSDCFTMAELHKRILDREKALKWCDVQRRENAIAMGVRLEESDAKYNFDDYMKMLPELIEKALEFEKEFKISFAQIRPYQ